MSSHPQPGAAAGTGGLPPRISESTSTILAAAFEDLSTDNGDDIVTDPLNNEGIDINLFSNNVDDDEDNLPLGASVSNTSVRIQVSNFTQKRKRSGNLNNNADDSQASKKGKPNIPAAAEPFYKAARNARAKVAKFEANEAQLAKYLGHTEHLAPANIKLWATPAFGADEDTMRGEWKSIITQAEKSLIAAEIEYLKRAQRAEETKARNAFARLAEVLAADPVAYNDAEAAIATVTSRVKAHESHKLRARWVHDIHKNEAAKVGLSLPTKNRGQNPTNKKPTKPTTTTQTRVFKQGRRRLQPEAQPAQAASNPALASPARALAANRRTTETVTTTCSKPFSQASSTVCDIMNQV